jgi:hypothetical protein
MSQPMDLSNVAATEDRIGYGPGILHACSTIVVMIDVELQQESPIFHLVLNKAILLISYKT